MGMMDHDAHLHPYIAAASSKLCGKWLQRMLRVNVLLSISTAVMALSLGMHKAMETLPMDWKRLVNNIILIIVHAAAGFATMATSMVRIHPAGQ